MERGDIPQLSGDILTHGRGDEHLLGFGEQPDELLTSGRIQLRKNVIQDDHRFHAILALHEERAEPQRQGEGPGLPVGGETLGWLGSQHEHEVVAVRADQRGAAVHLLGALVGVGLQQRGLRDLRGEQRQLGCRVAFELRIPQQHTHLGQVRVHGRGVRHVRGPGLRGEPGVGLRNVWCEVVGDLHPRGHDLPARRSQLCVPDVQGGEGREAFRVVFGGDT